MNKKKKPCIRFKGFTDDWEQRKLGDIVQITMGQSPNGETYSEKPSDYILVQGMADLKVGWVFPRVWTTQKTKTCDAGDLIMSVRAPAGAVGKTAYSAVIGRGVSAIKGNEFIYQTLTKRYLDGCWKKIAAGSTFESINFSAIADAEIMLPSGQEQKRIGRFFSNLDYLITLHQRKCEKLKIIKKSMLENCFPKNGQKVPKIRFSGFTGDWEQRKVGEFLTVSKIPGHTGIDAKKLTVKLWGKGIIGKNDVFTGSENTKYYIRRAGQFMYGKLDFLHAAFGIVPEHLDTYESTLDSPAFDMHDIDSHFLLERVMQKNFYLHNGIIANGSRKAKRIHENIFLDMNLVVPSYIEQEKIGSIFRSLDDLITLHQSKLEKLQKIKKSMLERMFV